ncbi:MAG: hydroxymethylglutaryl-CoA lyase [Pseudomonadota bacterium]|nr:hydroxymethylglutaryl-CoA lyase [Pseudomonadota bacterium]
MNGPDILVSEVGPRDGLQNIDAVIPTDYKKRWIEAEAKAGVREIEVGSFVPAKYMPQLADTGELVSFAHAIENLAVAVLVPNFRGAEAAVEAGVDKMSIPFSVSETHCQRNLNRSHEQMFTEIMRIVELLDGLPIDKRPHFEVGLSTAFGCSLEGKIADEKIIGIAEKVIMAGCDEVGLSDTTGSANPRQVRHLIKLVRSAVGEDKLTGVHLHNTRGLGLANALAALEEGITTLDSSLGGLGGCPAAPGASGNIVTEDLVFMLESMGLNTGVDIHRLLAVRGSLNEVIPIESLFGFTADAGLPRGY